MPRSRKRSNKPPKARFLEQAELGQQRKLKQDRLNRLASKLQDWDDAIAENIQRKFRNKL